jgi:beta-phosphoglucomutase-like phosphatase (HAD superfamily)
MPSQQAGFLFDLDGTLNGVYQHVLAWREALEAEGISLAVWRIHRKIGMSGGLFDNMLLRDMGSRIDASCVERLRRRHVAMRSFPKEVAELIITAAE